MTENYSKTINQLIESITISIAYIILVVSILVNSGHINIEKNEIGGINKVTFSLSSDSFNNSY